MVRWVLSISWISGLIVILALIIGINKPQIDSDILALMPDSPARLAQVEQHFFAQNKQQVIFSIEGENALAAYDELHVWLSENNFISTLTFPDIQALTEFYGPYAGRMLSDEYRTALANKAQFERFFFNKISQIADPFVSTTIGVDPSLSLASFLSVQLQQLNQFGLEGSRLTTTHYGKKFYLLFFSSSQNALGIAGSEQLASDILSKVNEIENRYSKIQIRYSGAVFHTSENASQAKYEMTLFGAISLIALVAMVWIVFASSSAMWLAIVTMSSALLGGFIMLMLVFNKVHVLTLVFAVTLIGIAIDYAFHAMLDLSRSNRGGYSNGLKLALFLSLLTTSLGYASLFFSPLLLLAQVGVFVVAGLFTAWLCTLLISCHWQSHIHVTPSIARAAKRLKRGLTYWLKRRVSVVIVITACVVLLYAYSPFHFNNDIRQLNASSTKLLANEAFHLTLLGHDNSEIMIMYADDENALLMKQGAFKQSIKQQFPDAELNVISDLLPSVAQQKSNITLLNQKVDAGVFDTVTGMSDKTIDFSSTPLTLKALLASPLKSVIENQVIFHNDYVATWFTIKGVDAAYLAQRVLADNDLMLYNKPKLLSAGLEKYSNSLSITLGMAIILAALLFFWRFGFTASLKQSGVLLCTLLTILILCSFFQGGLSIFNLLGCLLVVALSIDYLVFYQINKLNEENIIAISLSAASSMWVFGMLAMSKTPAIYGFGLTIMIGLITIYILAPLTLPKPSKEL